MPPINPTVEPVGIPESLTINGVTYTVKDTPELQQFVQKVSKVEKSKLYTQFENLKNQINNLNGVQVTNEQPTTDIDAIVAKLQNTFVTKDTLKDTISEVVSPLLKTAEQSRRDELSAYREKLINENAATCIPELVKGETKEELDNSLQESIRLRANYPSPSSVAASNQPVVDPLIRNQAAATGAPINPPTPQVAPTTAPTAPIAPAIPSIPNRPSPEVTGAPNVKKMSMGEFAAQRESLRQQLESLYGN